MKSTNGASGQSSHVTNEALIAIGILSLVAVIISAVLIWRQLAYMRKQDKTNELLTDLSSSVSAALMTHIPGGILGVLNLGQIDLFIHGFLIDSVETFFDPPLYSPPAGDQSYKLLNIDQQGSISNGEHDIKVYLKDALKRKWTLTAVATKPPNSRGFSYVNTISVERHNWRRVST